MGEFLKEILGNVNSLMLAIVVLLLAIVILGFIPLGQDANSRLSLTGVQRVLFGIIAIGLPVGMATIKYFLNRAKVEAPTNDEYESRFDAATSKRASITPEEKILTEHEVRKVRFIVYTGDISNAIEDVLVSSDDNYLQAKGGVAKAILDKAGLETLRELNYHRKAEPKLGHGDVVVTTGGATGARAIIHPAIIDLVQDRYPDPNLIRKVVRRCLDCSIAFGARSIAFPVLGGGTASKHLNPWDSIQAMVSELMAFVEKYEIHADGELGKIALYVHNPKTIAGNLHSLFTKTP